MEKEITKIKLENGIEYQDKTVVSKVIMKQDNGNITLFAFDKDESLSEHTSPYDAVVYVVEGEMEIKLDGVPYIVTTGELLIMPADIPHGLVALQKSKMLLTMIK